MAPQKHVRLANREILRKARCAAELPLGDHALPVAVAPREDSLELVLPARADLVPGHHEAVSLREVEGGEQLLRPLRHDQVRVGPDARPELGKQLGSAPLEEPAPVGVVVGPARQVRRFEDEDLGGCVPRPLGMSGDDDGLHLAGAAQPHHRIGAGPAVEARGEVHGAERSGDQRALGVDARSVETVADVGDQALDELQVTHLRWTRA
jgi:hypothetical protein